MPLSIANQFNKETERKDLLNYFMKHTLKQSEATSTARARAFNPCEKVFDSLESLTDQYKFPANNIYNVDENDISTLQTGPSKILAKMGEGGGVSDNYNAWFQQTVVSLSLRLSV